MFTAVMTRREYVCWQVHLYANCCLSSSFVSVQIPVSLCPEGTIPVKLNPKEKHPLACTWKNVYMHIFKVSIQGFPHFHPHVLIQGCSTYVHMSLCIAICHSRFIFTMFQMPVIHLLLHSNDFVTIPCLHHLWFRQLLAADLAGSNLTIVRAAGHAPTKCIRF